MAENKLFATVLQDAAGQSSTAFALVYQMATKGSAIGMVAAGISACAAVTPGEAPSDDPAVIAQCYLVPFKAVTKENYKSFIK